MYANQNQQAITSNLEKKKKDNELSYEMYDCWDNYTAQNLPVLNNSSTWLYLIFFFQLSGPEHKKKKKQVVYATCNNIHIKN